MEGQTGARELAERIVHKTQELKAELAKAIVGQDKVINDVILALYCGEHALLTGVPGLAKTLLIRSLAETLHLSFKRIQFTPDLMPSDITGTDIVQEDAETGRRHMEFLEGPVFANLVLADEINRTPPKTQAAMLQTMQEREVSVGRETYKLPQPFFVFATRNPIEQEGTYQLPEAATDRFMLSIDVDYPTVEEEMSVVSETTGNKRAELQAVLNGDEVQEFQRLVRSIPASEEVIRYAVLLVNATRPSAAEAKANVRDFVRWGAGPRASQYLILGAKGRAAIAGDACVNFDHVRSVARQTLEHRIHCNFRAKANGVDEGSVIQDIIDSTAEPR